MHSIVSRRLYEIDWLWRVVRSLAWVCAAAEIAQVRNNAVWHLRHITSLFGGQLDKCASAKLYWLYINMSWFEYLSISFWRSTGPTFNYLIFPARSGGRCSSPPLSLSSSHQEFEKRGWGRKPSRKKITFKTCMSIFLSKSRYTAGRLYILLLARI